MRQEELTSIETAAREAIEARLQPEDPEDHEDDIEAARMELQTINRRFQGGGGTINGSQWS